VPAPAEEEDGTDEKRDVFDREVPTFKYRPLEDSRLGARFFKLFPGDFEEPIVGELVHGIFDADEDGYCLVMPLPGRFAVTSLKSRIGQKLEYEAISWCWKDEPVPATILVRSDEGLTRTVASKGLQSALRHLRRRWRDRVLWIDALCINQRDTSERNFQVSNMSRIYHRAANVCVWLGMDSPGSKMAMQFKDELCDIERFDKIHENTGTADKLVALLQLLERQWFSRRWIIQEIVFARKATLHCGRDEVNWSQFATAIELLLEAETASQRFSSMMKVRPDFWDGSSLFEHVNQSGAGLLVQGILFRDYKTQSGSQGPLWSIEHLVSSLTVVFDASEPRDCIYALLGVANDVKPMPNVRDEPRLWLLAEQRITARYPVDYSKPYPEICMDFVEFCIGQSPHTHRALDIICRPWALEPLRKNLSTGELDEASEFLPSWVIKASETSFKIMTHTLARKKVTRQNADSLVAPPDAARTQYAASSNERFDKSKLAFKRRPNLRHYSMYVQGFIFDRVERVEASSQDGCIPKEWAELADWVDLEKPPPEAFWRTLVVNRGRDGRAPPIYYEEACWRSTIQGVIQTGAVNTSMLISNDRNSIISQFCKRVQASILNRRLIKTERGRLGLASKSVAKGDLLCVLPGCSVPVALRVLSKNLGDEKEQKEDALQRSKDTFKRAILSRLRAKQMKKQWEQQPEDYKRFIRTLKIPGWEKTEDGWALKRTPLSPTSEQLLNGHQKASEKTKNSDGKKQMRHLPEEPEKDKEPVATPGLYYNFLGECYVHGMMDGQVTEERKQRSIPYEVFEIR
jgi:hypothetical protein